MISRLLFALFLASASALAQTTTKSSSSTSSTATPQAGAIGAMKATTRMFPDGSRATNIVNPDKREATETVTDSAGKVLRKTWFSLDERDLTTGAVHYDAKGNIRYKETFKRDGADRITSTYLYSATDKYLGRRDSIYDSKGNIVQIDDYDPQGKLIPKATSPGSTRSNRRR